MQTQRLLLRNTPEDVLVSPVKSTDDCRKLLSFLQDQINPAYTIWLTQIEQIHQFVFNIPDLAWELMEYANEPLSIIYTHPKAVFGDKQPPEVCIRLLRQPQLLKILSGKNAWLSVRIADLENARQAMAWTGKEINCAERTSQYTKVKIMRVFDNGQFSFLS
uniref:Uncharacterized protein n=1 Tax=Roseihalotalea indica TaxID=2867963 RepID=A0AA49JGN6_9BACT|nr:hypothetical protein K4G66_31200 [Tunicatimonas sp. TK19036]